jgi:hypothetical protein
MNQQNRIFHRRNHLTEIDQLANTIELYYNHLTDCYESLEDFTRYPFNERQKLDFMRFVFGISETIEPKARLGNNLLRLSNAIDVESEALGNNLFALFNDATRYASHDIRQKQPLFGNPFGKAQDINNKAFVFCKTLAEQTTPQTRISVLNLEIIDIEAIEVESKQDLLTMPIF